MPLLHGTTRVNQPNTGKPGPELSCALSSPFPFASSARAERGSQSGQEHWRSLYSLFYTLAEGRSYLGLSNPGFVPRSLLTGLGHS